MIKGLFNKHVWHCKQFLCNEIWLTLLNALDSFIMIQGVSEKEPSKRPLFYKVANIISVKMLHI